MHGAACFGEVNVVRDLVMHGANLVAMNAEGDTPIAIAVDEPTKKYLTEALAERTNAKELFGLYEFETKDAEELSFKAGEKLTILTPSE